MIRQLVAALDDAGVEIDAEAIADALWLARVKREDPGAGDQRSAVAGPPAPAGSRPAAAEPPDEPGDARSEREREPARSVAPRQASHGLGAGASSITLAKVQALPGTLELGRALRPLKQRYPSKRRRSLNADATVQYFCDTGILTPIMRPGGERWFDVEVLFDAAPSMAVWRDLVAEFVSFLQRHGAFREVRRWNVGQVGQTVRLTRAADVRSEAAQPVNPDARQLIMIVTDGIAPMWYQAPIWDAIRGWGLFSPVVVISPLPARLWPGTALGSPEVTMRSHRPGAANRILDVTLPWWWPEDEPPWPAVPVPVITLEAGQVAGWARMAMGAGGAESLGMFAMPPPGRTGASPGLARPDAEERVRRFRVTVSPAACRLAVALSAVLRGPWQLGLARVVQKAVHPGSGPVQLAEVLVGGLVRQVERPADQEEPVFEFVDGVADVLQRSMTGTEALRVLEALSGYIERETGESPGIAALLLGETAPAGATEEFGEIRAGAANLIQAMGLALPPAAPGPSAEAPGASDPGEPRPQPRRVVQVIGLVDGRRQVGSGYRVAGRFVLTAAHCVRGATEQRVRLEDGEQPAQVVVDGTPDVDLALLEIVPGQTEYGPVAEVPPIRCARVDRDSSGQIECVASGFPQYAARADTPAPVQQVKGRISAAKAPPVWRLRRRRDQAGLLTVTVAGTTPYPLPTSETELSQSAWAGMSGAAVLAHGSLVGVVTENHLPNDGGSLTVAPIEWVERLDSADRARLLAALGLTSTSEIYLLRTDLAVPVDPERDHVRGPAEAAVTLVEYGDYEALYCGAAEPAIREVLAGHADLCLVWRHLPLTEVHPHAQLAAEAAEAAARQGMFWPMHDRLLDHQDALTADDLIRYAAELGLDTGRFTADLRSRAGEAKIAGDVDSADLSGVTGVPTFLINGRRHYGAYNTDALTKAVRAAGARPLARSAPPRTAQPYDVRVMPDVSPPGVVSIRDIGQQTIQREAAGTALEMSSRSTALDLLLGPGTDAVEALAGQILSAGGPQSLGRSLVQFPELTREVAAREVATTAAALLAVDLIGLLVAGWREHRDIVAAGRRTLAAAGSTELVSMSSHEITVDQRPSVSVLVDGHRIHDLQFGFSIMFNVSGLSLGISGGRLVAVNPGNCDVTATLTLQDTVFLARSARLEVTSDISSGGEILLLPMGEYPPTATRFWELLNPAERESLRAVGIWRTFEAGATIMQQGELADHVLVVLGGQAEILVEENGNERVVAVRGPGELIGERSALAVSERSATVVALEMVWALVVQGEDFAAFISAHPRILQIMEDQVRQRLATERPAGDDNDPANSPAGYSSNRPRGPYEGNCTVVIADVIDFGARNRTDSDIRLIREALFTMMENAIRDVPGARSVDRGDGFLTVVPPSVPPAEVLDRLLREFPAVLERHNGTVSESARFRLRLAVNVGPVAILEDEVSGEAISVAARLVDAAAFKSAVAAGPASFGVIVSPFVYETAVRPRPDRAEVASYSQVSVRMKGSSTPAWVRLIR